MTFWWPEALLKPQFYNIIDFLSENGPLIKPWSDNQINIPRNIICGNFDLYWQTKLLWCLYFGKSSDHIICEHTIYRRQSFRSIISPNIVLFSGSNNRVWLVLPIYLHCRGFSKGLVKNHITHTKGGDSGVRKKCLFYLNFDWKNNQ